MNLLILNELTNKNESYDKNNYMALSIIIEESKQIYVSYGNFNIFHL